MSWRGFNQALADTTRTFAMILFLVGGAIIFTRFMPVSRIPFVLASYIGDLPLPAVVILIIILLVYFVPGTFYRNAPSSPDHFEKMERFMYNKTMKAIMYMNHDR